MFRDITQTIFLSVNRDKLVKMQFLHNNGKLMTKIKSHTNKYIKNPQARNSSLKKIFKTDSGVNFIIRSRIPTTIRQKPPIQRETPAILHRIFVFELIKSPLIL